MFGVERGLSLLGPRCRTLHRSDCTSCPCDCIAFTQIESERKRFGILKEERQKVENVAIHR